MSKNEVHSSLIYNLIKGEYSIKGPSYWYIHSYCDY